MSNSTFTISPELHQYLLANSLRESDLQRELRAETAQDPMARMQISPEQGQFMALLVKMLGAKRCLEVGVFTGYSALCVALALPEEGRIIACDVSEEWTRLAQRYWTKAGVAHKIDLHLQPALTTLDVLLAGGQAATFDFAFIDADKENYAAYVERVLALLRPGGLLAIDNTLWSGRVADASVNDAETTAIRELNAALKDDARLDLSLLPVGDGLTLALKR